MPPDTKFENAVFRYRSMASLLGDHEELEKQSIYFASPEQLNDPMEGLRQVYWRGDRITWRNLLRHFVICLCNRVIEFVVSGDDLALNADTISVFRNLQNFPTQEARRLCEECITEVEGQELHAALLDLLAGSEHNITFAELSQLLRVVHPEWLITIYEVFHRHQLVEQTPPLRPQSGELAASLRAYQDLAPQVRKQHNDVGLEIINEIQHAMAEQLDLLEVYQNFDVMTPNRTSLLLEFPRQYLNSLMKLVYPPWYVACFSTRHDNPAMWSYYANDHNGCCLVFNTETAEGGRTLRLRGADGRSTRGVVRNPQDLKLNPVCYTTDGQYIEFFANIGRLSHNDLIQNWFQSESGETSPLAKHLSDEASEQWRKDYWENFTQPLLRKHPDWKHEQEHRIIISDVLNMYESDEGNIFTYDYDTLDGIIFGINVSISDKVHVMQIVDQKLRERTVAREFTLYQARYNQRLGEIEAHPLRLIRRN